MRTDQKERLANLTDSLTEVVLEEADPREWPGDGIPLADIDRDTRGDRYWCKKNAAATLSILTKVMVITAMADRQKGDSLPSTQDDHDMDKEIARAERAATEILEKAQARAYAR